MKHLLKGALPLVAAFVFTACGNSDNHQENTEQASTKTEETASTANPVLKDEKLNSIYAHYNHLTAALTNSDAGEAKSAAAAIESEAKNFDGGKTMEESASKIAGTEDLEEQRKAYQDLSNEMIAKIKAGGLSGGEVYVQHCPMAFKNTGADWLSNSKDIRNPYFGDKMMTCGEVTETIR